MSCLAPGIITKVNVSGGDYKMMDNISQLVYKIKYDCLLNDHQKSYPTTRNFMTSTRNDKLVPGCK